MDRLSLAAWRNVVDFSLILVYVHHQAFFVKSNCFALLFILHLLFLAYAVKQNFTVCANSGWYNF